MNHDEAIRLVSSEKYLLDELSPELRDQFEEHFFSCTECALDVRAGAMLIEQSKVLLSEKPGLNPVPAADSTTPGWLAWLRPAFAIPVLAALLAIIGYQNLVTYPKLELATSVPQILPWASLNVNSRGENTPVITVSPGQGFLLFVNIAPEAHYSSYTADLYNPAGKLEWSLAIPVTTADDSWPIRVPAAHRDEGTYTLSVHGITAPGENSEIGRSTFALHIQR